MRRASILLLAGGLLSMSSAAAVDVPTVEPLGAEPAAGVPGDYIVATYVLPDVKPGDSYMGGTVKQVIDGLNFVVVSVDVYALFDEQARADENVRYVEWDNPAYAVLEFVPNDSLYSNAGHWGSKKIGAETAWDRTRGSTAVKVAMIDSGLLKTHEDVTGTRVLQGYDFVNNDNNPNDESGCSYHGSHTTGTAGATINNAKGIAGMSQHAILPVKAFYSSWAGCSGSTTALVNALKYAGDQGAHVSSNSWGSSANSASINDAVQYAHNKGTIHVGAAGNSGPCTNCVSYPWKAKASVTIIVASTTSSDAQSSFSSEGVEVDVAAPGSSILSLSGSSATAYQTLSGTSMATPHVAGTAALIKALNPSMGFASMESRICSTALDLGPAGRDTDFGCGRLRASSAVY